MNTVHCGLVGKIEEFQEPLMVRLRDLSEILHSFRQLFLSFKPFVNQVVTTKELILKRTEGVR